MKELIVKTSDFLNAKCIRRKVVCPKDAFEGLCLDKDFTVNLRAEKTDNVNVYFSGDIEGAYRLSCARCLEGFACFFKIPISFDIDFDGSGTINIAEEVRQLLLIDIPAKPLCDDNCGGILGVAQVTDGGDYNCISSETGDELFIKEKWKQLLKKD